MTVGEQVEANVNTSILGKNDDLTFETCDQTT
jgi:hypothetical protein